MTTPFRVSGQSLTRLAMTYNSATMQGQQGQVLAYLRAQGVQAASYTQVSTPAGMRRLTAGHLATLGRAAMLFGKIPFSGDLAPYADDLTALRQMGLNGVQLATVVEILSYKERPTSVMKNGVLGFGTMGCGIAYKSAIDEIAVVVYETNANVRVQSRRQILKELAEGVSGRHFTVLQTQQIFARIRLTDNLDDVVTGTAVVHEAIFEDFDKKVELLDLTLTASDRINGREAGPVFATNTSSLGIHALGKAVARPERVGGLHYFNPVPRNRLVEAIRGEGMSNEDFARLEMLGRLQRKVVVETSDSRGFAVNRLFAPWYNEAMKTLERLEESIRERIVKIRGTGTLSHPHPQLGDLMELEDNLRKGLIALLDSLYKETFQCGMGPFELINVTGKPQKEHGLNVAYHTQLTLERAFGEPYKVARFLEEQFKADRPWDLSGDGKAFEAELVRHGILTSTEIDATKKEIAEHALGVEFLIAENLLEKKVVASSRELDIAVRVGLRREGPMELMKKLGPDAAYRLARAAAEKTGLPIPTRFTAAPGESVEIDRIAYVRGVVRRVTYQREGAVATITINRPEVSNALDSGVLEELGSYFSLAESDGSVRVIVLKGRGKDFVSGADLPTFIANLERGDIEANLDFTRLGDKVLRRIEGSQKWVVAVVDGAAVGGGLELALTADTVIVTPRAGFRLPEVGIGLIPGFAGTDSVLLRAGEAITRAMVLDGLALDGTLAWQVGLADVYMDHIGEEGEWITRLYELVQPHGVALASGGDACREDIRIKLREMQRERRLALGPYQVSVRPRKPRFPYAADTAEKLIEQARTSRNFGTGLDRALEVLPHIFRQDGLAAALSRVIGR